MNPWGRIRRSTIAGYGHITHRRLHVFVVSRCTTCGKSSHPPRHHFRRRIMDRRAKCAGSC
ncbi:MAG: hypothetical protein HYY16_18495 [Planctomycetes bacterium]|nr:hypothetical protein [Planctomycetota bacterium]